MSKREVISICCQPLTRTIDSFLKLSGESEGRRRERQEIVCVHGIIRHGNQRWFRGACVS